MEAISTVAAAPEPGIGDSDIHVDPSPLDFTAFYQRDYAGIARALAYTLGDAALATDATDEAMARAFARWSKVREYDNPGGWVYHVALNWARSVHRRAARRLPFRAREAVTQPPVADPAIERALAELDVPLRAVVVCRLLLDWSIDDTANALGIKAGTVKSRLHRALGQLETALEHLR